MRVALYGSDATPEKRAVNAALGDFVASRIWGDGRGFQTFGSIGVVDDSGTVVAAMIYHNWDSRAGVIEISGASDTARWLTRPVLREMFSIPFDQFGCQTVVMRCDPDDKRLARILTAYGFINIRLPRLRGRDKDAMLYILHDDAWRSNGFHRENLLEKSG